MMMTRNVEGRLPHFCFLLALIFAAASSGCHSSERQLPQAADVLAKTTQALQPTGQVTRLVIHDDRGFDVEVWVDSDGARARADNTTTTKLVTEGYYPRPAGYRISEIIANGETCDEIPSLSCANTADELLSLVLPWFVSAEEKNAPPVQSSTVHRETSEGSELLVLDEVTEGDGSPPLPFAIWPSDNIFCPLRRTLAVDPSSFLPVYFDVTLLCESQGYPPDYHYHATYSNIEFLDEGSVPETMFSPEAVRSEILDDELTKLKASPFQVYWLGSELPENLKINADDGLADARANWVSEDGDAAYFVYSPVHSSPAGLSIYELPKGQVGLHCMMEWPVSGTRDVTTKFGPALYCDAQEKQLVLTIGETVIRLVYSLGTPEWFVERANALVPLR